MKSFVKKSLLAVLAVSAFGIVGCGNDKGTTNANQTTTDNTDGPVASFVAVASKDWDTDVTIGNHIYKLALTLEKGGSLKLVGTCTAEKVQSQGNQQGGQSNRIRVRGEGEAPTSGGESEDSGDSADQGSDAGQQAPGETTTEAQQPGGEQQGQQPGGEQQGAPEGNNDSQDNPGGQQQGGQQGGQEATTERVTESPEQIAAHSFTQNGTWTEDTGYGYVLTIGNATYHTDYNKTEGRHEFYLNYSNDEGSISLQHMQAKDSAYRSKLNANYQIWDVRDSKYIFEGTVTGNNSSKATAYLYCHKDGTVIINTASGAARVQKDGGTWTEVDGVFKIGNNTADESINAAHPGKRIIIDGTAYMCSSSASVAVADMSNADFDGKTQYAFVSPDDSTQLLSLAEGGKAYLYSGASVSAKGTWTLVAEVFTISLEGKDEKVVTKGEDGTYSVQYVTPAQNESSDDTVDTYVYTPGN